MAVRWTEEQRRVIDTRGRNILVSAAAGSGKTAVLVARILALITGEGQEGQSSRPVDIDRLLVVTFTNAAAAEMRERIRDALEQRAEEEPENEHLQKQLVLVHNAKITTIHSFCLQVLRNHFQTIGIDPAFRVADEGEVLLLEQDTAKETVDDAYENADEEFLRFLEVFTTGKGDQAIEDTVLQLYHFALGQPWPEEWLRECRERCGMSLSDPGQSCAEGEADEKTAAVHPDWLDWIEGDTKRLLEDLRRQTEEALRITLEPDGPYPYSKALESDLELLGSLEDGLQKDGYEGCARAFACMGSFARLGSKKDDGISPEKKQRVQELRSGVKEALAALRKNYYYTDPQTIALELRESALTVRVLTLLTEDFMRRLAQKKTSQNLVDFGDLEHLALQVLVERVDGREVPGAAAKEYAESFEEIMIDEYQDSNLVQEIILNSVSGRGRGEPNLFMVGDVKQSIYRFRLARPELFMEKYKTYQGAEKGACRIDLHRNFRSRAQVLDGVNYLFRQIMTEYPGGIVYDRDAALYPGAEFAEGADETFLNTELLLLETEGREKQREEAVLVGRRIRELAGNAQVWDKGENRYRPVRYGDIVILLRTVSGWAEVFGEVLKDMGIPCVTGSQKGYFSAVEIRTMLSYLQILDNPVQDVPLAAVLRSAIGKFSDEELAQIRIFSDKKYFYDCCQEYRAAGPVAALREKLEQFFAVYEGLRGKCAHTPVHLLLWEILDVTGYGAYAEALPAGRQRRANLDMLVEKAIAYEATSYRGLYHFVRYIENLKKYEIDYGEANIDSEGQDTVRIMSIHKSKGLEFPIVFVSGLGKQFNESDVRSRVVMHPDFGVACDFVDDKLRTRRASLLKRAIQRRTTAENLGEELRVLYVALTRAKEKLILTGSVADLQTRLARWQTAVSVGEDDPELLSQEKMRTRGSGGGAGISGTGGTDGSGQTEATEAERGTDDPREDFPVSVPAPLRSSWIASASTYLDWIVPSLLRHPAAQGFLEECREEPLPGGHSGSGRIAGLAAGSAAGQMPAYPPFLLRRIRSEEEQEEQRREDSRGTITLWELMQLDAGRCFDERARAYLERMFASAYPYAENARIPGKLSVSELKKLSHLPEEQDARELYREETVIPLIPQFYTGEKAIVGAARGTVYHAFMEGLDFSREEELEIQLEEMISCGKMSGEEGRAIDLEDIRRFLRAECGQRMRRAFLAGQLFRERPFVLGVPANEIHSGYDPRETILVQGIIDAWFIEEGQIVVLDYKTDRVRRAEELAEKYSTQLDYYALALERLTGRKVRERIIYSFHLGEEVIL